MKKKALIIGIDGGTWSILAEAIKSGQMPFLSDFVNSGYSGTLNSIIPAITPAAWGSFQTGMNPGKTGVFDFSGGDKEKKEPKIVNSSHLPRTLWERLSNAGFKVGVINVPMTYPPYKLKNGFMVSGMLTPSLESNFTYPKDIKIDLLDEVTDYHIFNLSTIKEGNPHKNLNGFLKAMSETVERRAKAASYLLKKYPVDVMMVHFQASDVIQHVLWGYLDENHRLFDEEKRRLILEKFYRSLDEAIEKVFRDFKSISTSDPFVIFVSDHGFQKHDLRFNLGNWLSERGYLSVNEKAFRSSPIIKFIKKLDVFDLRRKVLSEESRKRIKEAGLGLPSKRYDWKKTVAFSVGRSGEGFVYITKTKDDKNHEKILERLKDEIGSIEGPSGNRIVDKVFSKEELYSGKKLNFLPDLIIKGKKGISFTGGYLSGKGLFHKVNLKEDFHIGKHDYDGIIASNLKPKNQNMDLKDLTPSILNHLGLKVSREIDGESGEFR